jgi:hypothetical protein
MGRCVACADLLPIVRCQSAGIRLGREATAQHIRKRMAHANGDPAERVGDGRSN